MWPNSWKSVSTSECLRSDGVSARRRREARDDRAHRRDVVAVRAEMSDDERERRRVPELAVPWEEVGVEVGDVPAGGGVEDLVEADALVPGVGLRDDSVLEARTPRR